MADKLTFFIVGKDQYSKMMKSFKGQVQALKAPVTIAATAVAGLTAALFGIAKSTATAYDRVGKFSDRIGISTEALSKYHFAAELSGIRMETMNMAFQRMTRRIAEANKGTGVAVGALKDLGIELVEIAGMEPDKQFEVFARALDKVPGSGERARLAMQLFDSEGVAVLQMLKDGSGGLAEMRAEAEKFGRVVTEEGAAKAAEFNDSLTRMSAAFLGLKDTIAMKVMPFFTSAFNRLAEIIVANRGNMDSWIKTIANWAQKGVIAVGYFVDAWRGLKMVWEVIKIAFAKFSEMLWKGINWIVVLLSKLMVKMNFKGVFDGAISALNRFRINNRDAINEMVKLKETAVQNLKDIIGEESAVEKARRLVDFFKDISNELRETEKARPPGEKGVPGFTSDDFGASIDAMEKFFSDSTGIVESVGEKTKFTGIQMADAMQTSFANMAGAAQSFGKKGKTAFMIFSAAEALASTYAGAARALKDLPFPFSWIVAGATVVKGLAYVASIKGIAHSGLENVPETGTYLLKRGERVLSPEQNEAISTVGGGQMTQTNYFTIMPNVSSPGALLSMSDKDWKDILEARVIPAMRDLKRAGVMV